MAEHSPPRRAVLFVCLGNICRSPMAEGVFRHLARDHQPAITCIDSCGTGAYHTDEPPDERTMAVLEEHGITDYEHGARKVEGADLERFDYIFAMDRYNLRDLEKMRRRLNARKGGLAKGIGQIILFGDYGGTPGEEVIDPYYGALDGFAIAYEQMVRFSKGFLGSLDKPVAAASSMEPQSGNS